MAFALAPTAALDGYRLEAHETVGSTNALALDRARTGDPGRLWIVSKSQESGRGRRGRAWATPHGNLAATLLLLPGGDLKHAATLGFVAGLALADALDAVVPKGRIAVAVDGASAGRNRFELKWPNDVLASGAKLAGILLESTMLEGGRFAVAVSALGSDCDAETLFLALSDAWSDNARLWNEGHGVAAIRGRWLERAAGLGGEVAVRIDGNVVRGTFETIDEDCRFVIRGSDGTRLTVAAGDVHFGAVASAAAT